MCKHVRGSTKSYTAHFEHEMQALGETFRHELHDRCHKVESTFDALNKKLLKRTIKVAGLPKKSRDILNNLLDMRSMFASIERIGDHATNIAESSIYAISGDNIRHQESKNE